MTDKQLAGLVQSDPERGLKEAIALYGGICKALLRRMTVSDQDMEDCLIDAYYKVWRNIGQFDPRRGTLKAWIIRIARNQALDWLRSRGESPVPLEEDNLGPDLAWEDETDRQLNAGIVRQTVSDLEEPDRTIFIRRYYYLEKVKDIAAYLQLSEKAVEHRLARGRERLKHQLEEKGVFL